jgi:hypothetical protein
VMVPPIQPQQRQRLVVRTPIQQQQQQLPVLPLQAQQQQPQQPVVRPPIPQQQPVVVPPIQPRQQQLPVLPLQVQPQQPQQPVVPPLLRRPYTGPSYLTGELVPTEIVMQIVRELDMRDVAHGLGQANRFLNRMFRQPMQTEGVIAGLIARARNADYIPQFTSLLTDTRPGARPGPIARLPLPRREEVYREMMSHMLRWMTTDSMGSAVIPSSIARGQMLQEINTHLAPETAATLYRDIALNARPEILAQLIGTDPEAYPYIRQFGLNIGLRDLPQQHQIAPLNAIWNRTRALIGTVTNPAVTRTRADVLALVDAMDPDNEADPQVAQDMRDLKANVAQP